MKTIQVIIPTHNRVIALEKTLLEFSSFCLSPDVELKITVSNNNGSNHELEKQVSQMVIGMGHRLMVPPMPLNGNEHLLYVLNNTPLDSDWYWLFGDDDAPRPSCIETLKRALLRDDIHYIHATDDKIEPIRRGGKAILRTLASDYGVLELYSFWSSQIFSQNFLVDIRRFINDSNSALPTDQDDPSTSFLLSLIVLESGSRLHGIILDNKAVHSAHTPEDVSVGNTACWFRLHKHFRNLINRGLLPTQIPAAAFNHHLCPIWVKQVLWLLTPVLNGNKMRVAPLFTDVLEIFSLVEPSEKVDSDRTIIEICKETVVLFECEEDPQRSHHLKSILHMVYNYFYSRLPKASC